MKKYLILGSTALAISAAFVGCSKEKDLYDPAVAEQMIVDNYNEAFIETFGEPDPNQEWGFGTRSSRATRANAGEDYDATSDGINANANEWADPGKKYGGWVVPNPLTEAQKALVARYFQTVDNLTYEDPEWRHFFVQQVYKGGNTTANNTTEGIIAADGTPYTSDNMDLLTVGSDPEHHINNFNGGSYGTEHGESGVGVLDKGYTTNEFEAHHHMDQIMLMVNIDDTHCMGYHCSATGVTAQRNDKAALVSWRTIAQWAVDNGLETSVEGSILNDTWNRSFVGFDLALKPFDECVQKDENGNIKYAQLSNAPQLDFIYDGDKVMKIGDAPANAGNGKKDLNLDFYTYDSSNVTIGGYTFTNKNEYGSSVWCYPNDNWSSYNKLVIKMAEATPGAIQIRIQKNGADVVTKDVEAGVTEIEVDLTGVTDVTGLGIEMKSVGTYKLSEMYVEGSEAYEYYGNTLVVKDSDGNDIQIPFLSRNTNQFAGTSVTLTDADLKITVDGRECINLAKIKELVDAGYYPTDTTLKEWSTWEDGDGYYSDWIVTLNEAQRIGDTPAPAVPFLRVMAEDLSASEASDFDFNDVVLDFEYVDDTHAKVTLQAAGGTLLLRVNSNNGNGGWEVHEAFAAANPTAGITQQTMINTNAEKKGLNGVSGLAPVELGTVTGDFSAENFNAAVKAVRIEVQKEDANGNLKWYELTAPAGEPACKVGLSTKKNWADEQTNINSIMNFTIWVQNANADL